MELRHLRYFVAVAEELNFTKAAQRMFTAQPSLSQQIKDLENEVGVQLLIRSNRKVELTEAGQVFLQHALLSLKHAEVAIQQARHTVKAQQQQLSIGFVPVAEMKIFPYIMPNIRAHYPDLNIHFHSLTDREQLEALASGEIDIAFTRLLDTQHDFENIKIFDEPLTLIMPKDALEASQKYIPVQALDQKPFIISDEMASPELHQTIQQFFKHNKINLNVVQQSTNILLNVNLVGMGVGWSLVPAYVIPLLGDKIVAKNTKEPLPTISLYASYRKGHDKPAIDLILKVLKAQFYIQSF